MRSKRWWNPRVPLVAVLALTISAVGSGVAPPAARGDDPPVCPRSPASAYTMTVGALTGPQVTDLTVGFTAAPGCDVVSVVKQLQILAFRENGRLPSLRILRDVPAQDGVVSVALARVERGLPIAVHALLQTGGLGRTSVLWGTTKALLRPDLVVASVNAPLQTLTTRPIDIVAEIAEINGDTAATAHIALVDSHRAACRSDRGDGAGRRARVGHVPGRRSDDGCLAAAEGGRDGRRTRGVRRHERRAQHDRGGDEQRARPAAPARPEPWRLRLPVERSPLCPDHESRPGDAARPGVEGEGARAAARPDLLQRQLGGERRRHAR